MSSPAQVLANKTNAALSTGPRTTEGKAASSQNALKFGLTSKQILLPHEDPAEFEAMEAVIVTQLNPANDAERLHVDDIVVARWKIHRTELAQAAWSANELKKDTSADRNLATAAISLSPEVRKFQNMPPPTAASPKTHGRSSPPCRRNVRKRSAGSPKRAPSPTSCRSAASSPRNSKTKPIFR